jgi:hypothetical protein
VGCEAEVKTEPAKTFYDKRCNGRAYDARLRVSLKDATSRSPHTLRLSPYNIWLGEEIASRGEPGTFGLQ